MAPPRPFSLNDGGPFFRLMTRLGMLTPAGMVRSWWLSLIAWLPLALAQPVRALAGLPLDPSFFDLSVHTRLLVALPMMLLAERLVEAACRSAVSTLYLGDFAEPKALDRVVQSAERLRDAWWPEAALAALAVTGGQLSLWQVFGPTGYFAGTTDVGPFSFARVWYVTFALPLVQFVMLRWLWRWGIWSHLLVRLSALPLKLLATHPDLAAGLSCLARPLSGFGGFGFATGAILAGAWGTRMVTHHTTVEALLPSLLAFLLTVLAVAVAPLLLFCGHLYRARRRTLAEYGDFATDYAQSFHARWILSKAPGPEALGSPDIQSLSDLANAFLVINKTRFFAFGVRSVLALWSGAILPMVPLFASMLTVETVLKRILTTILGGLPI
jgi:hypothetical protein